MKLNNETYIVCLNGKCVDIQRKGCEDLFDELKDQIECEELKKGL